jgi:CheY-like chemotaxis protein
VDDDQVNQLVASTALRLHKWEVVKCMSGAEVRHGGQGCSHGCVEHAAACQAWSLQSLHLLTCAWAYKWTTKHAVTVPPPHNTCLHALCVCQLGCVILAILLHHHSQQTWPHAHNLCAPPPQALEYLLHKCTVLPDLVLLDVMMPTMSGYEVATRIRDIYPSSLLPIIMVRARLGTHLCGGCVGVLTAVMEWGGEPRRVVAAISRDGSQTIRARIWCAPGVCGQGVVVCWHMLSDL